MFYLLETFKNLKISDFVIVFVIIVIQLVHQFNALIVPEGLTEIRLFSFNIGHFGFEDMNSLFWILMTKLLVIIPSILWFLTSKKWWRYAILIIIAIEFIKLIGLFNTKTDSYDEIEFFTSLPITLPIIIILILISKLINRHNKILRLNQKITNEIDETFRLIKGNDMSDLLIMKKEYLTLQKEKFRINKKEYLLKLIEIREKIYKF
ncbi:hypothetical protein FBALC1_09252 [Flavobacteriales bacterium ALC-1]|nr:hypothetical protein FBALC1_09252 [Flavobacteriales bacterium ALC-1]